MKSHTKFSYSAGLIRRPRAFSSLQAAISANTNFSSLERFWKYKVTPCLHPFRNEVGM